MILLETKFFWRLWKGNVVFTKAIICPQMWSQSWDSYDRTLNTFSIFWCEDRRTQCTIGAAGWGTWCLVNYEGSISFNSSYSYIPPRKFVVGNTVTVYLYKLYSTLPKTTCLPSNQGVGCVMMKNWQPFVSGPAATHRGHVYKLLSADS